MIYPPIAGSIVEIKLSEDNVARAKYTKRSKNNLHFINLDTKERFQMNIYDYNKKTLNPRKTKHPIRDSNRRKERSKVKNNQKNICRFVQCNYLQFSVEFHKKYNCWRVIKNHPQKVILDFLQIENKIFYVGVDNKLHYHYLNTKGAKIIKIYNDIPNNAHPLLIEKYQTFYSL